MNNRMILSMATLLATWSAAAAGEPPYPAALEKASVSVDRLDSILEHGLLVGNGDLNALVWTEGGQLALMLTKNDVWDARLDSKLDPPLPTLALIKKVAAAASPKGDATILPTGWGVRGADSYHAHPYPCPRSCTRLTFGTRPPCPVWRSIRALGSRNDFQYRDGTGVMSIQGRRGDSNGYALEPLDLSTDQYPQLRVKVSGTQNARYYVDVMDPQDKVVFASGWTETPTDVQEKLYKLPAGRKIGRIILYTWTEDGKHAENRFGGIVLEGPGGRLALDLAAVASTTCAARLDVARAAARVAGSRDGPPEAEIRVLTDRNVLLVRSPGTGSLAATHSADTPDATAGKEGETAWLQQTIPGDLDWPGMSYAVALAARGEWTAVAIVTSREARNPKSAAIQLAREAVAATASELVQRHEASWAQFWSASGIDLDDEVLEATWYRNLYFLRCVSRPGAIAPGLFASLTSDRPAWHGDYHTNYNIQQTFWSAYSANHGELAEPYDRLIREYLPRAQWLCRQVFSMDGAYFPHVLFAYEPPDPAVCRSPIGRQYLHHVWGFTLGVSGFTVQPLWWHYKHEPSRDFLEQTAYPAVREVARFYAEFVAQCEGEATAVLAPSVSPEHWGWTKGFARNRNCAFDIAMFRYTLEAAIEGAATLGRDADLVTQWKQALRRLPPYPTTKADRPVVVDVEDAPPINYNIAVPAVPVFPGDVITWWSPAVEKELFRRTIDGLQWNGNNSAIMLSVARARLSMPAACDWVRQELLARLRPNGTLTLNRREPPHPFNNAGHYTEQFGATMAVNELLLQSVGDVIRVFPAWPADRCAAFRDLRTQGGFLVSAECKGGKVAMLRITSTAGGRLRLLSPWTTICLDGEPLKPDAAGRVELLTQAGRTYSFAE